MLPRNCQSGRLCSQDRQAWFAKRQMELDDTDRRLIALLRNDARRPASSLAAALGVSRGTVQNRIARMLRGGVIQGFTLKFGGQVEDEGSPVRAVTTIEIRGRSTAGVV